MLSPSPTPSVQALSDTDFGSEGDLDLGLGETFSAVRHAPARPIFDKYQDADIVIQTRDQAQIRAHKWPLARDSVFFRDMFSLPQANCAKSRQLPVIPVEEDAETVENLLRILYPDLDDPDIASIDELRNLIRATHKYQFDRALRIAHEYALEDTFVIKHPVDCYVLGLRYEITGLPQLALSHMRGRNLVGDADVLRHLSTGELSGIEYWELMKSHQDQHGLHGSHRKSW